MTRSLSPRHRRTLLGRGAGRAVGYYEQCDHRSPTDDVVPSPTCTQLASLATSGLVGRTGRVAHHTLRALASSDHLSDFDARTIAIADLLSDVRLDATADLIMWHDVDGAQVATSIARLLEDDRSTLLLGGPDETAPAQWSAPAVLRSPHVPNDEMVGIVALTAMTFAQFIGDDR